MIFAMAQRAVKGCPIVRAELESKLNGLMVSLDAESIDHYCRTYLPSSVRPTERNT